MIFIRKIATLSGMLILLWSCQLNERDEDAGFTYTVNGKINIDSLDFSLPHEHIMSTFGADASYVAKYDSDSLFNQVIPYLRKIKSLGVSSIFDCTAAYFGRDVSLLKALADSTGMQIITNTGFYGAANDKYVPELAFKGSEQEIASIWIGEFENGIGETTIKPGFIKLAFDDGEPSEIDLKLFNAGILTHLSTGLTLAVHTGNNPMAAAKQLSLLEKNKINPRAWIWVHADQVEDQELLVKAAQKGAWISLDGINESNITERVKTIDIFKKLNLLGNLLLSHDGNSFPSGRAIRKYDAIPNILIPELKASGYSDEEINQLVIKNPGEAFGISVRTLE